MASKTPDPIDKYVGSRIRMRRIMLGMSQEKLGDALGLTFQQIQKYEKGTNRVGASRLQQISDVLQVHVSFMFEGAPGGTAGGGMALTKAFTRLKDAKLRRSIVDLVEQIAAREERH
jgi:transcriptional regulator with XRE-family HTH domain